MSRNNQSTTLNNTGPKPTKEQQAQRRKELAKHDKETIQRNIQNDNTVAFGLVPLILQHPRLHWELVSIWLKKHNMLLTEKV